MIRVGLVTSPLISGHSGRGIGFYTRHLLDHLRKIAPEAGMEIVEVSRPGQKSSVDLIHYPFFDFFSPTLPVFLPVPVVVTVHDCIPLEYPQAYPPGARGWINLQRQKIALTSVSRVITDSMSSLRSIRKHLPVPHAKLRIIPLAPAAHFKPLPPGSLTAVSRKYNLPGKFVLYVGDINYNKNLPSLVGACKRLDIPLVLVSRQAEKFASLDLRHPELAHLQPVADDLLNSTRRLGFVPDQELAAIYNLASVYCQPSLSEGFGLPVLEAMASGTTVIASSIGSHREIGADVINYFDPGRPDSLTEVLKRVLAHPEKFKSSTAAAITRSRQFSWPRTASGTIRVYREVVGI